MKRISPSTLRGGALEITEQPPQSGGQVQGRRGERVRRPIRLDIQAQNQNT